MKTLNLKWKIETTHPFAIGPFRFEPGCYYSDRQQAGAIMSQSPIRGLQGLTNPKLDEIPKGESLCVMRAGGHGDILMLSVLIREIKRRRPDIDLYAGALPMFMECLIGLPYLKGFFPYPCPHGALVDHLHMFGDTIEFNPRAEAINGVDCYFERMGMDPPEDRRPELHFTQAEEEGWKPLGAKEATGDDIAIQMFASAKIRSYPGNLWNVVVRELLLNKAFKGRIFLVGSPNPDGIDADKHIARNPRVIRCWAKTKGFKHAVWTVRNARMFVTPDSAMFHAGAALNKPTLGLYGPFPGNLRMTADCQTVMEGDYCKPCFHHAGAGRLCPIGCPSEKLQRCARMDSIDPSKVAREVMRIYNEG